MVGGFTTFLALENSVDGGSEAFPEVGIEPIGRNFDRVADESRVSGQDGEVGFIGQILSENEPSAGAEDTQHGLHAGVGVLHMVEDIDHDDQVEAVCLEGKVFEGAVVEFAPRLVLSFGEKSELVAAVAFDEGVGKNQAFGATGLQDIAHIGVGSAAHFDGMGDAGWQKAITIEAVAPPGIPVVAAVAVYQAKASQQAPDEILAEFCALPLGLVPQTGLPLLGLLPSFA